MTIEFTLPHLCSLKWCSCVKKMIDWGKQSLEKKYIHLNLYPCYTNYFKKSKNKFQSNY